MEPLLRIAVQKSGRLNEMSLKLLKECGLQFSNGKSQLKTTVTNYPAEILFLRDDDIPEYVQDGVADIGIVGENVIIEKQKDIDTLIRLGFAKCRLSIAVPKAEAYDAQYLNNKRIATSYPVILQQWLDKKGLKAELHEISGSVEIAPGIGLAEAVCDIVSTGSTLMSNGLKEVDTVMQSEAIMIGNPMRTEAQQTLIDQLLFRINAVKAAKDNKYILLNAPNDKIEEISNLIPGMKSPTVLPLAREGWSSLHSVMNENDFWGTIDNLKAIGAEGILVVPIEKMIL